jgi:dTMP kinase
VLFDLPPEIANERRSAARDPDRFESESAAFFARTRSEYLRRAEEAPYRFAIIDSSQSIARIQRQLEELLVNI